MDETAYAAFEVARTKKLMAKRGCMNSWQEANMARIEAECAKAAALKVEHDKRANALLEEALGGQEELLSINDDLWSPFGPLLAICLLAPGSPLPSWVYAYLIKRMHNN